MKNGTPTGSPHSPTRATPPPEPSSSWTPRQVATRPLAFLAHGLGAYEGPELRGRKRLLNMLRHCGIPCNEPVYYTDSLNPPARPCGILTGSAIRSPTARTEPLLKSAPRLRGKRWELRLARPRWAAAYKFPGTEGNHPAEYCRAGRTHRGADTCGGIAACAAVRFYGSAGHPPQPG